MLNAAVAERTNQSLLSDTEETVETRLYQFCLRPASFKSNISVCLPWKGERRGRCAGLWQALSHAQKLLVQVYICAEV